MANQGSAPLRGWRCRGEERQRSFLRVQGCADEDTAKPASYNGFPKTTQPQRHHNGADSAV